MLKMFKRSWVIVFLMIILFFFKRDFFRDE